MEFVATGAFGLEGLIKKELEGLGFTASAGQGGARFEADFEGAFKANLWLACADRVLLVLGEQTVTSFEELFQFVQSLPWEEYLPRDAQFPVSGNCVRSQLMSVSDCQSITKKAIVERLKRTYKTGWFPEGGSLYQVSVTIHRDVARLTLDTSGEALNKRGYRTWVGEAPLRETLAAALVRLAPWDGAQPLYDPCCGTGTLLIEAAFLASGRAPGLSRAFAMEAWAQADRKRMAAIRSDAAAKYTPDSIREISGSDVDPEALELCERHIRQAGLAGKISVRKADVREVRVEGKGVVFLTNPPYGE
ncbi:MAG TPA: class I SAM-dependent RNA methyltransferase, partial [Candidatus Limnocylindria bacterium]|nr:class I SAM-dependent RNA methyltransferase [Candidatus Limnocylindria bacterium]